MKKHKGLPDLKRELKGIEKVLKVLPDVAGQIAVEHAHDNFKRERFGDGGKSGKWAPRKKDGRTKRTERRGLLVKLGELLRSIDYETAPGQVAIGSDKPYAQVHNEGGKAGRKGSATIPQRKFMGPSPEIDEEIERYLDGEFDQLFG